MTIRSLFLLFFLASGCRISHPDSLVRTDYVEFRKVDDQGITRVVLFADGAARVDLQYTRARQQTRTFVTPVSPSEVRRVANAIEALAEASIERPINRHEGNSMVAVNLACSRGGRVHTAQLIGWQFDSNFVWKGAIEEIGAVAQLSLIESIDKRNEAEALAAQEDWPAAVHAYDSSLKQLKAWVDQHAVRYGGLWDLMGSYVMGDQKWRIGDVPSSPELRETFKATPQQVVDLQRQVWNYVSANSSVSKQRTLTLISFRPAFVEIEAGDMPSEARSDQLDALKAWADLNP